MKISPVLSCTRCGGTLHGAFVGRICPRCLLAGVASTSHEPNFSDRQDAALPVPPLAGYEAWHVGMRLGDYELLDVIGGGGMALVYLARQISLDRLVALKTIAAPLAADAPSQERFRREARAVAQLDHQGIVSVHDAGVLCGALFYTMDYIDGPDLGRVLRERSLPPRETAAITLRIADAVGYAHARGIIHRDLKPANILLDPAGEPRVADFGLALEARGLGGGPTLTGDMLGTPPYMAPEILAFGAKRATPSTDVYALGAMLFQMLTGRTPFIGDSPSEFLHFALHEQPPAPRLLNPAVPRDLETICLKCLEKDPAGRYASAGTLAEDLERFLAGESIHARPVSVPMRARRWSRRHPALATLLATLLLGACGATWAAFTIDAGRQRALLAESGAREGLWRANLAHAQAARRTTEAGARREALTALADAARFRPGLALRNEAIAALCLHEAAVVRSWPLNLAWLSAVAFAPSLDTYVAETVPGRLTRRACADDRELGVLNVSRTKVLGTPVFSGDGRYLAVRYTDNVVRVWETEAARILFELPARPSPMRPGTENYAYDLAFRPDGKELAVGSAEGGCTLHALPGGEETARWSAESRPSILRFSPDGSRLAVVGRQLSQVQFLDSQTLTVQRTVALPGVPICAAWDPAGDRLALGTRAARIHFVAPETGEITDTIPVYESGGVGQIVFHPQRAFLVGNGSDEAIRFWDAASGRLFMQLDGVNDAPVLAFDPTGTRLCTYNNYTRRAALVEFRHSPVYESVAPARPTRASIATGALDASRDGRWLVTSSLGSVQLRDAHTGRVIQTLPCRDDNDVMTAQFAPDGPALLVASSGNGLCRVEILVGTDGQTSLGPPQPLDAEPGFQIEGVSGAGRALLVSEEREAAKLVDPANPGAALRWSVPKITSAAFGPDGRQVLTEAGESMPGEAPVKVWDVSGQPRLTSAFGDDPGGRVQCSRDGRWVLVTGDRKTELWRSGAWTRGPALPTDLQGETHHARLSPDGKTLVVEKDGKLHLLATATGQPLATCEGTGVPAGICVNEVFSADGKRMSLLWQYGSVHVWDLAALHRELAALGLDWNAGK